MLLDILQTHSQQHCWSTALDGPEVRFCKMLIIFTKRCVTLKLGFWTWVMDLLLRISLTYYTSAFFQLLEHPQTLNVRGYKCHPYYSNLCYKFVWNQFIMYITHLEKKMDICKLWRTVLIFSLFLNICLHEIKVSSKWDVISEKTVDLLI